MRVKRERKRSWRRRIEIKEKMKKEAKDEG